MTGAAVETRPPTSTRHSSSSAPARAPVVRRVAGWIRVPWVACLVLLAAYLGLSLVNDPRGTLLADSGGKLATMRVMEARGGLDPDVGYWASADDPDGTLHPLTYTKRVGDAWVQASTLPMLYAAYPLYAVGGTRLALVLPMIGGVLCALAARGLARRGGGDERAAWLAFWAVGLVTPVALYATSFWEHTLGLAAILGAIALAVDVMRGDGSWRRALVAGTLFGFAFTMRSEALVYLAVTAAVALAVAARRRIGWSRVLTATVAAAAGFLGVVAANHMLELVTIDAGVRSSGSSAPATAARQVASSMGERLNQAGTSLAGVNGFSTSIDWVVGLGIAALVVVGVWSLAVHPRRRGVALAASVMAAALYLVRFDSGVGYVPGLLAASPLAALGVVAAWRVRSLRIFGVLALVPLPLIWLTQYADTQRYQWGSRYALTSGVLLAVAAIVALAPHRRALAVALGFSLLVTGFGVVFVSERSASIAHGMEALVARDDTLLVSLDPHLFREGGDFYAPGRRWLTATTEEELDRALAIARRAGLPELALVAPSSFVLASRQGGYERVGSERIRIRPESTLQVVTYHAE